MREVAMGSIDARELVDFGKEWKWIIQTIEVGKKTRFRSAIFADFGFAEENIALLSFGNNEGVEYHEVGIGEALRSYRLILGGENIALATEKFLDTINEHRNL